jgi:hypothetical protein
MAARPARSLPGLELAAAHEPGDGACADVASPTVTAAPPA